MARSDSIKAKGLENHVNKYLMEHDSPWRYKDLERMLNVPIDQRPSIESLRKIFGVKGYGTMEKWVAVFDQQKEAK